MQRPSLTPHGTYHPTELLAYLDYQTRVGVPVWQIARHLKVDADRIIYALGPGRHSFERKARLYSMMEAA